MNNELFVSVVMPVYGVEKYLRDAVNSVLAQTFNNFELILVDDCSPDRSGEICDGLAGQDERIRVLHLTENGGVSNARNEGIKLTCGQFIYFMDSDDVIEATLFEQVHNSYIANPVQIVVFGMTEDYYNASGELMYQHRVSIKEKKINDRALLRREVIYLEESTLYGYSPNKFYDAVLIKNNHIWFEDLGLIEDITFNINVFMKAESMNILDIAPYHYNKRMENSITSQFTPDYFEMMTERVGSILNQYKQWDMADDSVYNRLANIYVRYIFSAVQRNCDKRSGMSGKKRKEWLNGLFSAKLFCELISHAHSGNRVLSVMCGLLKKRRNLLSRCLGRVIYIVKEKMPGIFSRAKQNR